MMQRIFGKKPKDQTHTSSNSQIQQYAKNSKNDTTHSDSNINNNTVNENHVIDVDYNNSTSDLDFAPVEVRRVPTDQIPNLTEEQKNEVFTKVLTAANPLNSNSQTHFDYNTHQFVITPPQTHMAIHFVMESVLIHVDSEEAQFQKEYEREHPQMFAKSQSTKLEIEDEKSTASENAISIQINSNNVKTSSVTATSPTAVSDEEDSDDEADVASPQIPIDDHALKNQFNFSERASQTSNPPMRHRQVSTAPPPTKDFSATVSPSIMFDTYVESLEKEIKERISREKQNNLTIGRHSNTTKDLDDEDTNEPSKDDGLTEKSNNDLFLTSSSLARALKTLERLVNQNSESDYYFDYAYYEDRNEQQLAANTISNNAKANELEFHDFAVRTTDPATRGSFLPLWKFYCSKVNSPIISALNSQNLPIRRSVTSIHWNTHYTDLFAVSFGSYDFTDQLSNQRGLIAIYTLKNTSNPEFLIETRSGVMTCEFHSNPEWSSLLIAGLYDGTVQVFDIRQAITSPNKSIQPLFTSNDPRTKHTDPVWQVHWSDATTPPYEGAHQANAAQQTKPSTAKNAEATATQRSPLTFYSISSDGRLVNWTISKNELLYEEVVRLKLNQQNQPVAGLVQQSQQNLPVRKEPPRALDLEEHKSNDLADELTSPISPPLSAQDISKQTSISTENITSMNALASGTCFDFNRHIPDLFVVGTEEGLVYLYSAAYAAASQFKLKFNGHQMTVYSVIFNPFHPGVFLTCSADWTVKLWEIHTVEPVLTWDLNCSIGDIAWAPYSSTVFACVTQDSRLRVYDLSISKHFPLSELKLNTKKSQRLTRVTFNPVHPLICVGDDRGTVQTFKLSLNLRKMSAATLAEIQMEEEIMKMEKILIIDNRDPDPPLYLKPFLTDSTNATQQATNKKGVKNKNGTKPKSAKEGLSPRNLKANSPTQRQNLRVIS